MSLNSQSSILASQILGHKPLTLVLVYQTHTCFTSENTSSQRGKGTGTQVGHTSQEDIEPSVSSLALLGARRRRLFLSLAPTWHASPPTPATREKVRHMRHIPLHNGPSSVPVTFCPCPPTYPPTHRPPHNGPS